MNESNLTDLLSLKDQLRAHKRVMEETEGYPYVKMSASTPVAKARAFDLETRNNSAKQGFETGFDALYGKVVIAYNSEFVNESHEFFPVLSLQNNYGAYDLFLKNARQDVFALIDAKKPVGLVHFRVSVGNDELYIHDPEVRKYFAENNFKLTDESAESLEEMFSYNR